jgi:signal transduction histidine kinase
VDAAQRPTAMRKAELRVLQRRLDDVEVVEFSVLDSGNGLAPEVLERLYEAFYTTKTDGMGIGLNLCRSIVESHQGRMRAENLYNGADLTGCCFSFWIPVGEQHLEAIKPKSNQLKTPG